VVPFLRPCGSTLGPESPSGCMIFTEHSPGLWSACRGQGLHSTVRPWPTQYWSQGLHSTVRPWPTQYWSQGLHSALGPRPVGSMSKPGSTWHARAWVYAAHKGLGPCAPSAREGEGPGASVGVNGAPLWSRLQAAEAERAFGQHSQGLGLDFGRCWSQELKLVICVGSFQRGIFYDFVMRSFRPRS